MAASAVSTSLISRDADTLLVPFKREQLLANEECFNHDPAIRAAYQTLCGYLHCAKVVPIRGGACGRTNIDTTQGCTREFQLLVDRVFQPMLGRLVQMLWTTGFVGFTVVKQKELRVPILLDGKLYNPGVCVLKGKRVRYVGLKSDMSSIDSSICVFSPEIPNLKGDVVSPVSVLLREWKEQGLLRGAQIRLDRLAAQNLLMVQSAPATKEPPIEVSLYGDADRFAADASMQFYRTDTDMSQFHCHEEKERTRLERMGVQAPTLMSVPAKYQIAGIPHPTIHTNINHTEEVRQDNVFAVCGIPRSLVMASGRFTADVTASFRTMNATINRIRVTASDIFNLMYTEMYPDDPDVQFEVEMDALITTENVLSAANLGFISQADTGRLFLRCANIPESMLCGGLLKTAVVPEDAQCTETDAESRKRKQSAAHTTA
jgi:hypothetical protein